MVTLSFFKLKKASIFIKACEQRKKLGGLALLLAKKFQGALLTDGVDIADAEKSTRVTLTEYRQTNQTDPFLICWLG